MKAALTLLDLAEISLITADKGSSSTARCICASASSGRPTLRSMHAVPVTRRCVVWIELDRASEHGFGAIELPAVVRNPARGSPRFCQVRVQLQSLCHCLFGVAEADP